MQYVYNDLSQPSIYFKGSLIQIISDPNAARAEVINCNFIGNTALTMAALYSYSTQLRVANILGTNSYNPYFIANNTVSNNGVIASDGNSNVKMEFLQFVNNTSLNKASALYYRSCQVNISDS